MMEVTQKRKISIDAAAIYLLEHVYRIAPDWLHEKKLWDGTHLTTNGMTEDYATVIRELQANVVLDFLTDAAANRAHRDGAVYRGMISVGVDHAINNDTASGPRSDATLGSARMAPERSKYVHVQFQPPGHVSAGQELDIKKK